MAGLFTAAGSAIDRIKINSISSEWRDGRAVWVKRRRRGSGHIIRCANLFFRAAGNPVSVWSGLENWQRWEVDCFQMLNGDAFRAFAEGPRGVCAERLPGRSLSQHLDNGSLTTVMLEAAAREFRRAHGMSCPEFDGPWSHGDPHLANLIFDDASGRARLIDFEVIHDRTLPAAERHADDLLVFLQDLMGRVPDERWLPSALCLLNSYGRAEVVARLRERLIYPRGVPRIWWAIRTRYTKPATLRRRIQALREALLFV